MNEFKRIKKEKINMKKKNIEKSSNHSSVESKNLNPYSRKEVN